MRSSFSNHPLHPQDSFSQAPDASNSAQIKRWWVLPLTACLLLFLAGCNLLNGDDSNQTATLTPSPTQLANADNSAATPGSAEANQTSSQETIRLIVWTIPEISPRSEARGGSFLAEQFNTYDINKAQVNLEVLYKATSGQGSILSYLRAGRGVADGVMPDLILLPSDQLTSAAEQQLIYPLDDLLPSDALTDIYPAAVELATVNGRLMGFPYALNSLSHLAYHSNVITGTLPSIWTGLVETNTSFVYPVSGPAGGALALQFYLAEGGSLVNDAGQTSLQLEQLVEAFTELDQGHNNGLFPTQSHAYTSFAETWDFFVTGQAEISLTVAEEFLLHRNDVNDAAFAPIPGPNGSLAPLIKGWVWAITTADPIRQAQAIDLIMTLTSTNNLSSWSQQSNYLPASRSALARWNQDAYTIFLAEQLEQAEPFPARADSAVINALSTATFDLFSSPSTTPETAADNAFSALRP